MKKCISLTLALLLVLSLSAAAFAQTYEDMTEVTITKVYEAANEDTTSPAETFQFTIGSTSVTDAAEGVTVENMPIPTVGSVTYASGQAGSDTRSQNITVTLPTYSSVGIYTYTIRETAGTTAGVTYFGSEIRLVVTVLQTADGRIRVAAVHTEADGAAKSDSFVNTYSAGTLAVTKTVTGNMGDRDKEFNVKVTFTAPEGKTVGEAIAYMDGGQTLTIPGGWTGTKEVTVTLKHDETVTFTNLPYGVTYTVTEDDYTAEAAGGYDAPEYAYSDNTMTVDSPADTVRITNNKDTSVDTGVSLDSLPFVLILAACVGASVLMIVKRRKTES